MNIKVFITFNKFFPYLQLAEILVINEKQNIWRNTYLFNLRYNFNRSNIHVNLIRCYEYVREGLSRSGISRNSCSKAPIYFELEDISIKSKMRISISVWELLKRKDMVLKFLCKGKTFYGLHWWWYEKMIDVFTVPFEF